MNKRQRKKIKKYIEKCVMNTPEMLESIRKSEDELKAGRYRKYEEFAKELDLDIIDHNNQKEVK